MKHPVITFGGGGFFGEILSIEPTTITRDGCIYEKELPKFYDKGEITITFYFKESRLAKRRKRNKKRRSW